MKHLLSLLLGLSFLFPITVSAQVIIQPQGLSAMTVTIDNLYNVLLINSTSSPVSGYLEIKVDDPSRKLIFLSKTPLFTLPPGTMLLPLVTVTASSKKFGTGAAATTFSQVGKLPYGSYQVCYTFLSSSEGAIKGVNCSEIITQNPLPPYLISPANKEVIATTYPNLVWHGPSPLDPTVVRYSIKLTRLKRGQSYGEALRQNPPYLNSSGLMQPRLPYPPTALPLHTGEEYVWQVEAYAGDYSLGITEMWSFRIGDESTNRFSAPEDDEGFYPRIENFQSDGYYITDGIIRFAYDNRSSDTSLVYKIVKAENTAGSGIIDSLSSITLDSSSVDSMFLVTETPAVPIIYGMNQLYIDLTTWTGWIDDQYYILEVADNNGRVYKLTYLYQQ